MWSKTTDINSYGVMDSNDNITYDEALISVSYYNLVEYDDRRLPTAKELQSIVDYSRSHGTTV